MPQFQEVRFVIFVFHQSSASEDGKRCSTMRKSVSLNSAAASSVRGYG
jgi:hypothetical protein